MSAGLTDVHGLGVCLRSYCCRGTVHVAAIFARNASPRVPVPTGILVVAGTDVVADLDDAEHAAHFHRAERTCTGHHGQRVVGQRHLHRAHVRHALFTHRHVVGYQTGDALGDTAHVCADQVGQAVAHRVHGVVRLVAVDGPVAGDGVELDRSHLSHRYVGRDLGPARRFRNPSAVRAGDLEVRTVHMDGVVRHCEIADADANTVARARYQRVDAGKDAAVPRPQVEVRHFACAWRGRTGLDVVTRHDEHEVAVYLELADVLGMNDEEPHHSHRHLHHFIGVRVVHVGTRPWQHELVDESLAGLDVWLRKSAHTVHAVGKQHAVPVHGRVLRQLVGHEDAHAVAFHRFDGGAGARAVVAPEVGLHAGRELAHDGLSDEVELLDAVPYAPGKRPTIERGDRVVGAACLRNERWLHRRRALGNDL